MNQKFFLHPCVNCGYCCLVEVCPVGLMIFGGDKHRTCPALRWDGDRSKCGVVEESKGTPHEAAIKEVFGIDTGCCVKARVRDINGVEHDFAALPEEVKIHITQRLK